MRSLANTLAMIDKCGTLIALDTRRETSKVLGTCCTPLCIVATSRGSGPCGVASNLAGFSAYALLTCRHNATAGAYSRCLFGHGEKGARRRPLIITGCQT